MKSFIKPSQYAAISEQKIMPSSSPVVLVVDDSATNRIVIARQLSKLGCTVRTVNDGPAALNMIEKGGINLVLLDCQMSVMSGYEVAGTVRKKMTASTHGMHSYLPIIAISGDTSAAHMQRCFDSGMDAVLGKPLLVHDLHNLLALWCRIDVADTAEAVIGSSLSIDLQNLYRTTSREDFDKLCNCVHCADFLMVGKLTHRMKGAAFAIGARPVVTFLERIELIAARHCTAGVSGMTDTAVAADRAVLSELLELLRQQLML